MTGRPSDNAAVFVFDPSLGRSWGWTYYHSTGGERSGPLVGGSNTDTQMHADGCAAQPPSTPASCASRLAPSAPDLVSGRRRARATPATTDAARLPHHRRDEEIIMSGMPGDAPFETRYRTPWMHAGLADAQEVVASSRLRRPRHRRRPRASASAATATTRRPNAKRQYTLSRSLPPARLRSLGTVQLERRHEVGRGQHVKKGDRFVVVRASGCARAMQLMVEGGTPGCSWGIDAIVLEDRDEEVPMTLRAAQRHRQRHAC